MESFSLIQIIRILNGIDNVYIWPDGETPKRKYEEGGYRVAQVRRAGRAVMRD